MGQAQSSEKKKKQSWGAWFLEVLDSCLEKMEALSLRHTRTHSHAHHKRHRLKLDVYSLGLRRAAKQRDVDLGPPGAARTLSRTFLPLLIPLEGSA